MFSFFSMANNYEQRKVARHEAENGLIVDTAAVTDSKQTYETGVCHPAFNGGDWVIVELYDTKGEAQTGHDKWVAIMTADSLPEKLVDVSSAEIAELKDCFADKTWREKIKD